MRTKKPSRTASKIALGIVTLGAKRGMEEILPRGIVDATANLLVESGAVGATSVRCARSRTMLGVHRAFDWMMPGQLEALGHRKAFCDKQVREGIRAGARQVLVLGAGYDTMGWRLAPEFASVSFFEIDHPATAELKAKGIAAMGPRSNLHLIAEDLGNRRLADVLRGNDVWDPAAPSVIVAEGLLMYLSPEAVCALFEQCAEISGTGSRIAFTYLGTRADGRPDAGRCTRFVVWLLEVSGEPWLWSIAPENLAAFLDAHGWASAPDRKAATRPCGAEYYGVGVR